MRLSVLGALSAHENGRPIDLGGRQQRLVLALLIMRVNEVVSLDRLLDEMWGEAIPASARKAVQGYVSNLRKVLGADTIRTEPTGYRLIADRSAIDAAAFEDVVKSAHGDADPTATLTNALAMWRGRAYEDLDDSDALNPEIERLDELRLAASEMIIEFAIDQGRSSDVVADSARFAAANPFRERTHALHITALYRAGRQRDALQAYEELRQRLATEIGVEPSSALKQLEVQILAQDSSLEGPGRTPSVLRSPNPYRGLRPFDELSGDTFFGRDSLVRRLVEHVERPAPVHLTVVAGASGSGKSSVVRAGLVPQLMADGRTTATLVVTAGSLVAAELANISADVVVLDQLESALIEPDAATQTLVAIVATVTRPDGPWLVATLRADYLDALLANPAIGPLVETSLVLVPPMTDRELTDAIVEPANRAGVRVSDGLTQELVSDMRNRSAGLPLLQYALTETYEAVDTNELAVEDYRSVGGLGGALARRAETLIESMQSDRREVLRSSLLRMVTIDADGQPGLRTLAMNTLTDEQRDVLELFGEHRMVTFEGGGEPSVSISHEALLREWPRLGRWIDDARDDLVALRRLSVAAKEWDAEARPKGLLFSSALVARYENQLEGQSSRLDREFLSASRESAEQATRHRRRSRRLIGATLGAAALVAAVFALVAQSDRRDADEQRALADDQRALADIQQNVAEQRALVSEALLQAQNDQELGLLLAAEAYAAEPGEQSLRPVLSVLSGFPAEPTIIDEFTHGAGEISGILSGTFGETDFGTVRAVFNCAVDLEPGIFLSASREDGTLALVDAETRTGSVVGSPQGCRVTLDEDRERGLTEKVSPRSTSLRNVVFDLESSEILAESSEINQAEWLPDGRILGFQPLAGEGRFAMGDQSDSTELIWSDSALASFTPSGVTATAIYPDRQGAFIVLSDWFVQPDGTVDLEQIHRYVVDARDLSVVHDLGVIERTPTGVVWSPDSSLFGDVSSSGRVRIWSAVAGELVADGALGFDTSRGAWIAFSPNNARFALVLRSGEVTIRPLDDPSRVSQQVRRSSGPGATETALASFIDNDTIAVLLDDGSVEVTNLRSSVLGVSRVSSPTNSDLLAAGWASDNEQVYGLTDAVELVTLADPSSRSDVLLQTTERPAIAGISPAMRDGQVHVWVADLGSPTNPGSLHTVDAETDGLAAIGAPVEIQLLPGTRLVAGLSDRVVAQNSGGTIFQFGYDGRRLSSRVDLPFVGTAIAQSPASSLAIVAGSGQVALVDLDSGEVIEQVAASLAPPVAMVSDDLAVVARLGGDIELWSTRSLESIGPLILGNSRGRNEALTVTPAGELWYHSSGESQQIVTSGDAMAETACRLVSRSLTEAEWRQHVSSERPFEPTC